MLHIAFAVILWNFKVSGLHYIARSMLDPLNVTQEYNFYASELHRVLPKLTMVDRTRSLWYSLRHYDQLKASDHCERKSRYVSVVTIGCLDVALLRTPVAL